MQKQFEVKVLQILRMLAGTAMNLYLELWASFEGAFNRNTNKTNTRVSVI